MPILKEESVRQDAPMTHSFWGEFMFMTIWTLGELTISTNIPRDEQNTPLHPLHNGYVEELRAYDYLLALKS